MLRSSWRPVRQPVGHLIFTNSLRDVLADALT
jgi:hypothetical protein